MGADHVKLPEIGLVASLSKVYYIISHAISNQDSQERSDRGDPATLERAQSPGRPSLYPILLSMEGAAWLPATLPDSLLSSSDCRQSRQNGARSRTVRTCDAILTPPEKEQRNTPEIPSHLTGSVRFLSQPSPNPRGNARKKKKVFQRGVCLCAVSVLRAFGAPPVRSPICHQSERILSDSARLLSDFADV